jgi:hypothetical protein
MVSGNRAAVVLMLVAITLVVVVAAGVGARQPSTDKLLDDIAWLIAGLTLSVVVARAVFAERFQVLLLYSFQTPLPSYRTLPQSFEEESTSRRIQA